MRPCLFLVPMLLLAATPFWETKEPKDWDVNEVNTLLGNSPWAQLIQPGPKDMAPEVQVYLATAEPMEQAEERARASRKAKRDDPLWQEYREYVTENKGKIIVLAIRAPRSDLANDDTESMHMQKESYLRVGKRKYKITGHFPPSSTDPYIRLVFPREVQPGDRSLIFELYVPGTTSPYRRAEFELKDLKYHGEPCY